ncbi:MAG: hypothetical protein AABN33_22005 [Acidobacteriota bacterium]
MSANQPPKPPPNESPSVVVENVEEGIEKAVQTELADTDPLATDENELLGEGLSHVDAKHRQKLSEQHEVHETRLGYVPKLFWLIVGWLVVTTAFLTLTGFNWHDFKLSDKVLIALITSTTANVLGLFYVVAKWLYPAPLSKKRRTKKDKVEISKDEE